MSSIQQSFQDDQNQIELLSEKIESGELNKDNLEVTIQKYKKYMDKWSSFGWAGYIKNSISGIILKAKNNGLCSENELQYYLKQLDEHLASLVYKTSEEDSAYELLKMFNVAKESGTLKDFDPIKSFGISPLVYITRLLFDFYSFVSSKDMGDKILEHVALNRMMYTRNGDQNALLIMHELLNYLQLIGVITQEQREMLCGQVNETASTFLNTFAGILSDSLETKEETECTTQEFK